MIPIANHVKAEEVQFKEPMRPRKIMDKLAQVICSVHEIKRTFYEPRTSRQDRTETDVDRHFNELSGVVKLLQVLSLDENCRFLIREPSLYANRLICTKSCLDETKNRLTLGQTCLKIAQKRQKNGHNSAKIGR